MTMPELEKQTAEMTLQQLNFVLRLRNERNLFLAIAATGWLIIFLIVCFTGV